MSISQNTKDELHKRAGGKCECTLSSCDHAGNRCTRDLSEGWDVHHKVSVTAGGSDTLSNLTAMCAACHKNTQTYEKN